MGSGASSEADAHLRKWEVAVNDLAQVCYNHKKQMDGQQPINPLNHEQDDQSDRSLRRRASSLVSFGDQQSRHGSGAVAAAAVAQQSTPTPIPPAVSPELRSPKRGVVTEFVESTSVTESPANNPERREKKTHNRQQVLEIKRTRMSLYKSYVDSEVTGCQEGRLACAHFATVAVALSALLGGHRGCDDRKQRVTVEDIFFAAQAPLHKLHQGSTDLTELYDIVREFVDVDNRFKNKYAVEVEFFDIAPTVGQVEMGSNDVGDRQSKIQLPDFRRSLSQELDENKDAVRIANFDPFIVEQAMLVEEAMANTQEEEMTMQSSFCITSPANKSKYVKDNEGAFGILVDFRNAVQPMITLAKAAVDESLHVELEEVPATALFKAMRRSKPGHRSRGYIRVAKRSDDSSTATSNEDSNADNDEVGWFFSPELCSGKVLGAHSEGNNAQTIITTVSQHITSIAWALHMLGGARPGTHGHGKGLPVSDIIRTMRLPADVFLRCDLPLDQVHIYASEYLAAKGLDRTIGLQLCPILTKINRDDAVPTISVFDLESILMDIKNSNEDPEDPGHIMIIQYNANIAHNVLNIAVDSQWCILVGYDEENQMARLIDANAKRFCTSWTCPLDRLHQAMTTYGYLVMSRLKEARPRSATSENSSVSTPSAQQLAQPFSVGALRHITSTVQMRLDLLKSQSKRFLVSDIITYFQYPQFPFAVTQLAVGLTKIGFTTTFEDVIHALPFDISTFCTNHIGIEPFEIITREYLRVKGLTKEVSVENQHFDRDIAGNAKFTMIHFEDKIKECTLSEDASNTAMIVQYSKDQLNVFGANNPFGDFGIITAYNEQDSTMIVSDVHPNRFYRSWQVDLMTLYGAISFTRSSSHRSRGFVILKKRKEGETVPEFPHQYRDLHLSIVPLQNMFHISPSPQVQGLSMAFAQLGHFYSPEEIFYEAYLKTMSDQRRRGSQAFAWRDVEVSLGILKDKIDASIMTLVARKFLESRKVFNIAVEVMDDVDVDEIDECLEEAADPTSDSIWLLAYNTQKVHNLSMGNSVAMVQSYDPKTKTVGMFEAEYSRFGLQWTCSVDKLIEAGDLDNDGRSAYGFVKVMKKDEEQKEPKSFNAFGEGSFDAKRSHSPTKRVPATTFV